MEIDNQKYIYSKNDKILKSGKIEYSVAKPIQNKNVKFGLFWGCISKLKNPSKNDLKTTLLFYALMLSIHSPRITGKRFPTVLATVISIECTSINNGNTP